MSAITLAEAESLVRAMECQVLARAFAHEIRSAGGAARFGDVLETVADGDTVRVWTEFTGLGDTALPWAVFRDAAGLLRAER